MPMGYRSVLQLDASKDAIRIANEQFRAWLAGKADDQRSSIETSDWDGPGVYSLGPDTELTVVEHCGEGGLRSLMLELVDKNSTGIWTTRMYATSAPRSEKFPQALWFESEGKKSDGSSVNPGTPGVVKRTLETVDAHDSIVPILSSPLVVSKDEIETLVRYISDKNRSISIVVAAPIPGLPTLTWQDAVNSLTRDALGCASFFVLDTDVDNQLNERLGSSHAIPQGAIRTFSPLTDLDDPSDSRRHRILTARTMVTELGKKRKFSSRLVRAIAVAPRRVLLETELPPDLNQTSRILHRKRIRIDALTTSQANIAEGAVFYPESTVAARWEDAVKPVTVSAAGQPGIHASEQLHISADLLAERNAQLEEALTNVQRQLAEVRNIADERSLRIDAVTGEAERLQSRVEELEDRVFTLSRSLEFEQLERALAEDARREAEKKRRHLEHWLSTREDRYEFNEPANETWESDPVSVIDIVERLTDEKNFVEILRYIELTDVERAIDRADKVDAVDNMRTYAAEFWEFILVLYDFAKERLERGFQGGMHQYLNSSKVRGRKCPSSRHKSNESETVRNNTKMRGERIFAVPTAVDPTGRVLMTAHFAPTHRDQNAPRMYYYDDLSNTGKIYIGYIGVHLTNTKTN